LYLWLTWLTLSLNLEAITQRFLPAGEGNFFTFEEARMFEVTALAVDNLKAYLEQNKISSAIRIALMQGG
jgi:hypothetical protein